ncbi:MAG: hypothetical protein ACTSYJ_12445 [Candidatus Thorarchaeota archaeon]
MKQERFGELAGNGLLLSVILFLIFVLLGLWLENDIFLLIGVLMGFYLPALLVTFTIWVAHGELRNWKKKRRKAKRQSKRKSKSLMCPSCEKVFNREELDLSPTAVPFCPDCEETLVPYD